MKCGVCSQPTKLRARAPSAGVRCDARSLGEESLCRVGRVAVEGVSPSCVGANSFDGDGGHWPALARKGVVPNGRRPRVVGMASRGGHGPKRTAVVSEGTGATARGGCGAGEGGTEQRQPPHARPRVAEIATGGARGVGD